MILDFLSSNNTIPVVAVVCLGVLLFALAQSCYIVSVKVDGIKRSTEGKIEKAIDDVVLDIEEVSYVRAEEIMTSRWKEISICRHGEDAKTCDFIEKYYNYESDKFRGILHESLTRTKQRIETHVKINGFHSMNSDTLKAYKGRVGSDLFDYNKRIMRIKGVDSLDLIKNTHERRFTKDEAICAYGRIIDSVISIRKNEVAEIKEVKKKLRMNRKVASIFKGYLDG